MNQETITITIIGNDNKNFTICCKPTDTINYLIQQTSLMFNISSDQIKLTLKQNPLADNNQILNTGWYGMPLLK